MSEYSSLDIPSGFRVDGAAGFFVWEGPGVDGSPGSDSTLRTSAAVAAMVAVGEVKDWN